MNYLKYVLSSIILFSFSLVLSSNIAYSSSAVSRTTESTASNWRASTDRRNVDTFDLKVGNQSFSQRNQVNGANINNISADKDNTSILIALSPNTDGTLNIELPRSVIDSKDQGNIDVDEDYIVFAEGQQISAARTLTNNQLRTFQLILRMELRKLKSMVFRFSQHCLQYQLALRAHGKDRNRINEAAAHSS
jgi:hypothetical protein